MVRIAIDAMGGDHAPDVVIQAVNQLHLEKPSIEFLLFGDSAQLDGKFPNSEQLKIIHTQEIIDGHDEPVKAIRRKKDSSMIQAVQAVKDGRADVVVSAGNTGALLVASLLMIGRIKNIDRPGLMPILPTGNDIRPNLLLMDAGANADTKAKNIQQFAILADFYAKNVLNIQEPVVGLINNGAEATKGSELSKEAYQLLAETKTINFYGNIEAINLLQGFVDIAVSDGFTGNAVLKSMEGTSKKLFKELKQSLTAGNLKTKLGGLLVKDALAALAAKFDDSQTGGAVLLGLNAPVIKAHGSSSAEAIYHAMIQAQKIVDSEIIDQMKQYFNAEQKKK